MLNRIMPWLGLPKRSHKCATSKLQARKTNGQFMATKDIPLHLRDKAAFAEWCYKEHGVKFKTQDALDYQYNKHRGM